MSTRSWRGTRWPAVALAWLLTTLAASASAQTPFVPYYGKNQIRYDTFDWHIYETDHFEIFYYPDFEEHLERVASYAESAYQHVSSELKHDLATRIPLVLFMTHSEFEQQNIIPGAAPEGVAAFAEPLRDRMVLPIDAPPDQLYSLIVHELTHIFEFDIIPRGLIRGGIPLWIDEGLADYMAAEWSPLDLMTVRDAAVADILPQMSELEGYGDFNNPRLIYNLGHAAFEFIEERWGKEGIRQFLFSLRKSAIGGGTDAYQEALRIDAEEFDQEFDKYLKDRFRPYRDKERPADYGRNLAPDPQETRFTSVLSIEPSPTGELLAAAAVNRRERKLDLVLVSADTGEVVRNLTPGFDTGRGYEYIALPSARFNTVPWMSWAPNGDRLAYFVRTEKVRSLLLQNVVTRDVEERFEIVDIDAPESPDFSPDGRHVAFSGLQNAVGDIFVLDTSSGDITNLTQDEFADYAPTYSPDGQSIYYIARISGNDKIFRIDLETRAKTQLTFGTHDDAAPQFLDHRTLVFSSTAVDPTLPVEPEVARNGDIYNVWTLDVETGELKQFTDVLTSNVSTVVLGREDARAVGFVTYFKGEYGVHTITPEEPVLVTASEEFGEPGPISDFQAPLTHTLIASNRREKKPFEKMFLEGRPPVSVGVTSGGDLFGGTAITFSDVLGDQQFNLIAASVAQYRTLGLSYVNLSKRLQWAAQGYSSTEFFYGVEPGVLYDPGLIFLEREDAIATRTSRGGTLFAIYPLNRYRRIELFGGVVHYREEYNDPFLEQLAREFQQERFGSEIFRNGIAMPLGLSFVQETTVFREFGPLSGSTMRLGYQVAPKIGESLSRQTFDGDARYYQRLGGSGVLALRLRGFKSWGEAPDYFFFGGNSEMRGYGYLQFVGNEGFFANAELRFPLIEAMLTPIGVLGGVRGVFFANLGGSSFNTLSFTPWTSSTETVRPIVGAELDTTGTVQPILGDPVDVSGFRLIDSRASYGFGLQSFLLGFPIHFDWSWRTLFNTQWEDVAFSLQGGSKEFRRPRFQIWIGYDY